MRLELRLILWVTACLTLGLWIVNGGGYHARVDLGPAGANGTRDERVDSAALVAPVSTAQSQRFELPEIDPNQRPMFRVAEIVEELPHEEYVAPPPSESPLRLKGVMQQDGLAQALFAAGSEASGYVVAKVGDAVDEYRVVEIGTDSVTAVRLSDGAEEIFKLRGAGESP